MSIEPHVGENRPAAVAFEMRGRVSMGLEADEHDKSPTHAFLPTSALTNYKPSRYSASGTMPSNLKRLLNDVDDVDYYAVEQYARRPPAPSRSPSRELGDDLRSRSPGSEMGSVTRSASHRGTLSPSPTRARDAGHSATLRDALGDLVGVARSSRASDNIPEPAAGGLSMLEAEMNTFGQDLAAYATSTGSGMSRRSSLSHHATSVFTVQSPAAPSVSSSEGHSDADDGIIVCYGMLHKIDVKIIGDMSLLDARLAAAGPYAPYQRFSLTELPDHIMLTFKEEHSAVPPHAGQFPSEFGYLRSHMKASLDRLLSRPDVEFEAVAPTGALRDIISGFKKSSDALVRVDVNVYGPRGQVAKTVGRMLSRNRLYLQTPDISRPDMPYENPQRVSFVPGGGKSGEVSSTSGDTSPHVVGSQHVNGLMNGVYAAMSRDHLQRADMTQSIRTDLLPHQEEALDFLLRRETGNIEVQSGAWREMDEHGHSWHTHVVTGHKLQDRPDESVGGIFADESGMGKTLSMLSLVLETKKHAQRWMERHGGPQGKDPKVSHATLVIVPSDDFVSHWTRQIQLHIGDQLSCAQYGTAGQVSDVDSFEASDVVVTTYSVLAAEYMQKKGVLHHVAWFRVVLDEAHFIAGPVSVFYRACCQMVARFRWCMTSMPVRLRLGDLGTMLSFVGVEPFQSLAVFRRYVEVPFEDQVASVSDAGTVADFDVIQADLVRILTPVLLRRTRQDAPGCQFVTMQCVVLPSLVENGHYAALKKAVARHLVANTPTQDELLDMASVFSASVELRLAASHGTFYPANSAADSNPLSAGRREQREAAANALALSCSACGQLVVASSVSVERCRHVLCVECLAALGQPSTKNTRGRNIERRERTRCPMCTMPEAVPSPSKLFPSREPIGRIHTGNTWPVESHATNRNDGQSSKMDRLLEDLHGEVSHGKSVVYSCWTLTLDLVAAYLDRHGVAYQRIGDDTPLAKRQGLVDGFAHNPDSHVLLVTTGTGAFRLDLSCARCVFVVEPQWSIHTDREAIARVVGLGKPANSVKVFRYAVKGTVEESWLNSCGY